MARLDFLERLRPASFTSPSGLEAHFSVDVISRVGGKKATIHEILNSNIAMPQDQGNKSFEYPMNTYFIADDGDIQADAFFDMLGEHYSGDSPGILHHPTWGDIRVMPFSFSQTSNLLTTAGVWYITVSFRPIPDTTYPTAPGLSAMEIEADVTDLESIINTGTSSLVVENTAEYVNAENTIKGFVAIIRDNLDSISSSVDEVNTEMNRIEKSINDSLRVGEDISVVITQVNKMIRLPSIILTNSIDKVKAFGRLTERMSESFLASLGGNPDSITNLNNAILYQSFAEFAAACTGLAAITTDYETRDAAGTGIDTSLEAAVISVETTANIYQEIANFEDLESYRYAPDHNVGSQLATVIEKAITFVTFGSFNLAAKKQFVLDGASDAVTLTWELYRDMSQLEFFIRSNRLNDSEMVELPRGRDIVYYG